MSSAILTPTTSLGNLNQKLFGNTRRSVGDDIRKSTEFLILADINRFIVV